MARKLVRGLVALLVLTGLVAMAQVVGQPVASASTIDMPINTVRRITIDPASGRVMVAGDDKVLVYAPDGTLVKTIDNLFGASGMDIVGGFLWVGQSTAGKVSKIDLSTLTISTTYSLGAKVGDNLAVVGGGIFFGTSDCCGWGTVKRFDLTTSALVNVSSPYGPAVTRIPGDESHLLIYERGLSSGAVLRHKATAPYSFVNGASANGYLGQVALSPDGSKFFTASGSPYVFQEFHTATMTNTGTIYPASHYPSSIATSAGGGGVLAGSTRGSIYVSKIGEPISTHKFTLPGEEMWGSVVIAPDASKVYAVIGTKLWMESLAPTIISANPNPIVADVPAVITVQGGGLGLITSASIGGVPATTSEPATGSVKVTVPNGVAPGARNLTLVTPFGSTSTPITVQANVGATLSGTVKAGSTPLAGVVVTLSGGGLSSPRSKTTDAGGNYSFTGVPHGTTYKVVAHDPGGSRPDLVVQAVSLVPNNTTTLALDFQSPPPPQGALLARVKLPSSQPRSLQVDGPTGRVFVTAGDEIIVFDANGTLITRFQNQWGADGTVIAGGSLYVNLRQSATIVRIDVNTLTVTGSWPLNTTTDGALAYASNKLWFVAGNDQWTSLRTLDPTTGAFSSSCCSFYVPRLGQVVGSTNTFLVWEPGLSSQAVYVMNATTFPPTTAVSKWDIGGAAVGNLATNRLWSSTGREFNLATLEPTGVQYPGGAGPVAYSPGQGGVLLVGKSIAREGTPAATHVLSGAIANNAGLNVAGTKAYTTTMAGDFEAWDLAPRITGSVPSSVAVGATGLTLTGSGFGTISNVKLDGVAVSHSGLGPTQFSATFPALGVGTHTITVTTPWGTSPPYQFTVVAPTAPLAPGAPTATAGDAQATVTWSPPGDGGSPITGYRVTASPGGNTCTTAGATSCTVTGLANGVNHTFTVRATNAIGNGAESSPSNAVTPQSAGRFFHGVQPQRILDSRPGIQVGPYSSPWTPATTRTVMVTGGGGVPSNADAVVLNVTVTGTTASGFVTIWPSGQPKPNASSLNWVAGQTVPNAVTVKVGQNGSVDIFNPTGNTHVIIDVVGYYDQLSGERYNPLTPARVLDSRASSQVGPYSSPWSPANTRQIQVTGTGGVPVGATSVVLNVTVTNTTADSFLTLWPSGPKPTVSSLNWRAGQTIANAVTAKVGAGGTLLIFNPTGNTDVIVDVAGYFTAGTGSLFHPTGPTRIVDSRPVTQVGFFSSPWGAGVTRAVNVTGAAEVPSSAVAVLQNVTITNSTASSYLTIWPAGPTMPLVSSLNWSSGQTVPNAVTVRVGTGGEVRYFNSAGSVDVVIDSSGWYG